MDLPLLEDDRWRELLLSVELNEQAISDGTFFIEDPKTGRVAIDLETAKIWRLILDPDDVLTFQGVPFYPLDAIDGARWDIDRQALSIDLFVPPEQFEDYEVELGRRERSLPQASLGAFLDYDLVVSGGTELRERLDGLFEAGIFGKGGVFLNNWRLDDLGKDPSAQRLETVFSKDFPLSRTTLRIGDSLTVGGAFARGQRFGGVQWSSNFGTDPSFVTFPLPAIGGLAEQEAVVDVVIDNVERATETVPPGPFSISNLPVVTGAGEVQLRITDLLGRERLVTQPYYVSSRLLRQGLHEFSIAAGFERDDFLQESFNYGDPLLFGTHRYGLSDAVTSEVHGELQPERASLVAGGSLLLGSAGLLSGGLGASYTTDVDGGVLAQGAYEYNSRQVNLGLRSRYTSSDFRQTGDNGKITRTDQANIGLQLGDFGRLSMLLLNRKLNELPDNRLLSANYSLSLGPGALIINAARTLEPDRDYALSATYAMPIGKRHSVATRTELAPGRKRLRGQLRSSRGSSALGLDYRIAAELGDDARSADARFDYRTSRFQADLDLERARGSSNVRAGLSGSLALVEGKAALSRRIGRAFGLVDLPGFPDVRVYVDNREVGRTNADGRLLLPRLRPYQRNKVEIAVEDLPLQAKVSKAEAQIVPYERSGVEVAFDVQRIQQSTARLLDPQGQPLPAGLVLLSDDGNHVAYIARAGFAQIDAPLDQQVRLEGSDETASYRCDLAPLAADEILPDRGELECRLL